MLHRRDHGPYFLDLDVNKLTSVKDTSIFNLLATMASVNSNGAGLALNWEMCHA